MRQRNLSPRFFTDPDLIELPAVTRIFFEGLWCEADREGRLRDEPRRLKVAILPTDNCDGEEMMASLANTGKIQRYEVDGVRYVFIPGFTNHQKIHPHEAKSVLPAPPTPDVATDVITFNDGCDTQMSAGISSLRNIKSIGTTNVVPRQKNSDLSTPGGEIQDQIPPVTAKIRDQNHVDDPPITTGATHQVWATYCESTNRGKGYQLDEKRLRCIKRALSRYPLEDVLAAVVGWRHVPHNRGENDRHTVYNEITLLLKDAEHIEKFRDAEYAYQHRLKAEEARKLEREAWQRREAEELAKWHESFTENGADLPTTPVLTLPTTKEVPREMTPEEIAARRRENQEKAQRMLAQVSA